MTGHTHIPLAREHNGVLLINPGAIAPGNAFLVQKLRSVATLDVAGDGRPPAVTHVDIDRHATFALHVDPSEPFDVAAQRVQRTLLADGIRRHKRDLDRLYRTDPAFRTAWLGIAHRVWAGAQPEIGPADLRTALQAGGADARAFADELDAVGGAVNPHRHT